MVSRVGGEVARAAGVLKRENGKEMQVLGEWVMSDDDDAGEFVDLDCKSGIWVASFCHVLRA